MIDKDDGEDLDQLSDLQLESDRWEGPNDEAFLTTEANQSARFVLPGSAGAELAPIARENIPIARENIDSTRDLIFLKSYYSAFKDGTLVQTLRAKFVTEIYLCGALTNISIFATAMDAARHGYTITIVEDCLGYRSRARHDAALTKLTEFTGCDILNSADVLEDLASPAVEAPQVSQLRTS
jgi:nicotinamidase-related amidase